MTSSRDPGYRDGTGSDREFFSALFARRIPEVANGAIRVVDAVRDPGRYAKVSVLAAVDGINAASTCIGQRGIRVHEVEALIPGERISVVNYDSDPIQYVVNALAVEIESADIVSAATRDLRVIVSVHHFATAIGRDARNVRLASDLTGWRIAICTARCTTHRHIHPRFDSAAGVSVWDSSTLASRATRSSL